LLEHRLRKLEVLLGPPEPTWLEILRAAYALREQRQAEAASKPPHSTDEGEPHHA